MAATEGPRSVLSIHGLTCVLLLGPSLADRLGIQLSVLSQAWVVAVVANPCF